MQGTFAMHALPETGYLRLNQIIGKPATKNSPAIPAILPISRSSFWKFVANGRFPAPTRALGERITAWRIEDVRAYLEANAPKVGAK